MSRLLSPNFFSPTNALRRESNARTWAMLNCGLKIKYGRYWDRSNDKDSYYIGDYELPSLWQLMTEKTPICNIVEGQLQLTQRGKDLLAEIVKTYDGKYTILGATYSKKPTKAMIEECVNGSNFDGVDYDDVHLWVKVQEIVRNKKTNFVYLVDMRRRIHSHAGSVGFMNFLALSKDIAVRQINDFLTEKQKADMTEMLLANDGWHIRDYLIA